MQIRFLKENTTTFPTDQISDKWPLVTIDMWTAETLSQRFHFATDLTSEEENMT